MLPKINRAFSVFSLKDLNTQKVVFEPSTYNEEYRNWYLRLACVAIAKCPFLFRGFLPRENHITKKLSLYNFMQKFTLLQKPFMVSIFSKILRPSAALEYPESLCQDEDKILVYHTMNQNMLREIDSSYLNILVLSILFLLKMPFMIPLIGFCSYFEWNKSLARKAYIAKMVLDVETKCLIVTRRAPFSKLVDEIYPIESIEHSNEFINPYYKYMLSGAPYVDKDMIFTTSNNKQLIFDIHGYWNEEGVNHPLLN